MTGLFKRIYERFYFFLESWRYRCSACKVYKYPGACFENTSFDGHNTLFRNVSCIDCHIGEFTYIQNHSSLLKTKIGKFCSIADHVRTGFGNHPVNMVSTFPAFYYNTEAELKYSFCKSESQNEIYHKTKNGYLVEIGNDVWIGSHVLIMDGVVIGDGAVVAAGSVVTKDIPPYAIYGGVPAKLLRYRFDTDMIDSLLDYRWWDKDVNWIKDNFDKFVDPHALF